MKRIIIRLSLFLNFKRIKSYILKVDRLFKKRKIIKPSVNYIDDPFPVYINITNRRAKFILLNLRVKFGSFCYAQIQDKLFALSGCRGPPLRSEI